MKRLIALVCVLVLILAGYAFAKQWDDYSDMGSFPDGSDTLLFHDVSEPTDSEKIKEVTISTFFGAFEQKPVYVPLTGTSVYTINLALGNVFFIDSAGATGETGVSIYLQNVSASTSPFGSRPYWIVNDTSDSGTTKVWLVPQWDTSQCTQWVVAGNGVTSGQSGVSPIGHERMDSRMDSVMILPRFVSSTGGTTNYVINECIH